MFQLIKKIIRNESGLDAKDLKNRFSQIYSKNIFGGEESRSGGGSTLVQTALIRQELPELIKELSIKSFMDAPCGDWNWMKETQLEVEQYLGVDIVQEIVNKNQELYGNNRTNFVCLNLAQDTLPTVDMIFCRDCLVHLTNDAVKKVLINFKNSGSKYLLTTTFTNRERNYDLVGNDIWRTLNLELPPFNLPKPLKIINENCTESNKQYTDKSLGLWLLEEIE